jgi:hypothetical protein
MSQLNVGSINVTGGLTLPQFNNTTRPAAPPEGTMIYNTEEFKFQLYSNGDWIDVAGKGAGSQVDFKIWGAGGGSGAQNRANTNYHTNTFYNVKEGGAGGFVEVSYIIPSGTSLLLSVGGGGTGGLIGGNPSDAIGGYNGGGGGTYTSYDASGGGGGYSGVFIGSQKTQAAALIIAPGGGGGAGGPGYPANTNDQANGGGGVNNTNGQGNNGARAYGTHVANAGGGTPTAGGVGGDAANDGAAGAALQGANAVHHRNVWGSGGGGGGGWYGGGSGAGDGNSWSGGGGGVGSGFVRGAGVVTSPGSSLQAEYELLSHTFHTQTYGSWGDDTAPGYNSMRKPVGTTDGQYPGSNVGWGGSFRIINDGGPSGYTGEGGAIIYRIDGGNWTTLTFTGSDSTITI